MKNDLLDILEKYLTMFPNEIQRQETLLKYLKNNNEKQIIDWNNFNGHIVASGFIYAKEENKFLVLYHNDLKMYLYPGGHINSDDTSILDAAIREVKEETGLIKLEQLKLNDDSNIPIDIDTHMIRYNERLNLPEHYHFDFRYLFMIDKISEITLDTDELSNYKWISISELSNDINYGTIIKKIEAVLLKN